MTGIQKKQLGPRLGLGVLLLGLVASSVACADDPMDKEVERKRFEMRAIEGDWRITEAESGGDEKGKKLKGFVWTFKGDQLKARIAGDPAVPEKAHFMSFKVSLDSSKEPKQMTLTLADEAGEKVVNRAIYDLEDGKLKICWTFNPLPGVKTPFPKAFKTEKGDKMTSLFFFERAG